MAAVDSTPGINSGGWRKLGEANGARSCGDDVASRHGSRAFKTILIRKDNAVVVGSGKQCPTSDRIKRDQGDRRGDAVLISAAGSALQFQVLCHNVYDVGILEPTWHSHFLGGPASESINPHEQSIVAILEQCVPIDFRANSLVVHGEGRLAGLKSWRMKG